MAIARRDMTVQLSYQFGLWARLGEALLFSTTLYFLSKLVGDTDELARYGGDYFAFAFIGVVVVSFATLGLGAFSRTIADEQRAGTLEVLMSLPAPLGVVLGGAFVVPLALTAVEILVYGLMASAFGTRFSFGGVLLALPVLVLTIASFCALGVLSAGFMVLTKRGDPFTLLVTRATTLMAGSLFPVSLLPGWMQTVSKGVPAYYGLRAMRSTLLEGAGLADIAGDIVMLAAFAAVLLPLSLIFFSQALHVARVSGTLGTY